MHTINQTPNGVAIQGYDPVAYHTESRAMKGSSDFEYIWQDARWQFASAANRDRFAAHPERYAPEHGGYCKMAMTRNQLTASDPNAWAITAANIELVGRNWQNLKPAQPAAGVIFEPADDGANADG